MLSFSGLIRTGPRLIKHWAVNRSFMVFTVSFLLILLDSDNSPIPIPVNLRRYCRLIKNIDLLYIDYHFVIICESVKS